MPICCGTNKVRSGSSSAEIQRVRDCACVLQVGPVCRHPAADGCSESLTRQYRTPPSTLARPTRTLSWTKPRRTGTNALAACRECDADALRCGFVGKLRGRAFFRCELDVSPCGR